MKFIESIKSKINVINELFRFLWKRKMWWLIPLMFFLILFSLILIFAQATPFGPLIYTLF